MKKRMAKMVPVLCVAAMVGLTACSSAKPAETKAPETKAEAASEKEPAGEEPAAAVDFPKDTLNIICHAAAGGGSDALARQVAQGLQDGNGWTVTVDNKTGGSGSVGMQFVMNSKPDGYTIGTAPVELSDGNILVGWDMLGVQAVQNVTRTVETAAEPQVINDPELEWGREVVEQEASPGLEEVNEDVVYSPAESDKENRADSAGGDGRHRRPGGAAHSDA